MKTPRTLLIACVVGSLAISTFAQEAGKKSAVQPGVDAALSSAAKTIAKWGHDPVLVREVKAQNAQKMTLADIQAIDKEWIEGGETARVNRLLTTGCASHLKELVASDPAFSESFVMDNQGANVCMTNKTSDFWQGDEAKWQKSFNGGKGTIFIDQPKYDTSAKAILAQISVAVFDGDETIGAITVGVNTSLLKTK
jgi:hypothetical protein